MEQRGRQTETDGQRQRQGHIERETDIQTETERGRQTGRQTKRERERERERKRVRESKRKQERAQERESAKKTEKDRERPKESPCMTVRNQEWYNIMITFVGIETEANQKVRERWTESGRQGKRVE